MHIYIYNYIYIYMYAYFLYLYLLTYLFIFICSFTYKLIPHPPRVEKELRRFYKGFGTWGFGCKPLNPKA